VTTPCSTWWDEPQDQAHDALFTLIRNIEQRQTAISNGNVTHAKMYCGYTPTGLQWSSSVARTERTETEATKNLVRSVVDTAHALISKTRPKATVSTVDADWKLWNTAVKLDKFLYADFDRTQAWTKMQSAFRDSCIFGTGVLKLIPRKGVVDIERVLSDELVIDEAECPNDPDPTNWYHRRRMEVDTLVQMYPEREEEIRAARGRSPSSWVGNRAVGEHQVVVVEAFHLGPQKRRVLAIEGVTLEDGTWPHDFAPYVVLYWSTPVSGFYGDGLAYRLAGRQRRINYLYRWIQRCQDLIAVPRVYVDASNGPLKLQMTNEIGAVIGIRGGKPPVFQTPIAVTNEVYSWLNQLEQGGYEDEGISLASAANTLPKGIESAPAQREYSYKEGARFAPVSQRYEDAFIKLSKMKIAMYRHMKEDITVKYQAKRKVEPIDWAETEGIDEGDYQIRIEASSMDSLSPAGRIQAVLELMQAGLIQSEEGRRLLGHPDLSRSDDMANASRDYAEWVLSELLEMNKVYCSDYEDLQITLEVVRAGLLRQTMNRAPRKLLEHLIEHLRTISMKIMPPPPAPADAMAQLGTAPPGAPGQVPLDPTTQMPVPGVSVAAAQGLNVPFSSGGQSHQGI
jgi:hypothetical protein